MEWIYQQRERWRKGHADAVLTTRKADIFPSIGAQSIDITQPPMILLILRVIESRGALEITAKVLQRMNAVFQYSAQTGQATYNPAGDMQGVLKTKEVSHMTALSREDLPEFLRGPATGDIHTTTRLAL